MLIIETFYGFVEVTLQNAYFTLTVDLEFMFCLVYADGLAHLPSFGIAVETGKAGNNDSFHKSNILVFVFIVVGTIGRLSGLYFNRFLHLRC